MIVIWIIILVFERTCTEILVEDYYWLCVEGVVLRKSLGDLHLPFCKHGLLPFMTFLYYDNSLLESYMSYDNSLLESYMS